jgi:hypothetical protein
VSLLEDSYATTDAIQGPDEQERPSSTYSPQSSRGKHGQDRSQVACGRVMLLADLRHPGRMLTVRQACDRKACPACGPRLRRELAEHYTAKIGHQPVTARTIQRAAWPTLAKRLQRASADYVRIPQPGRTYLVLATIGPGEPVTDPAATLHAAFQAMPNDRAHVTSARAWALRRKTQHGEDASTPRWELIGNAAVPYPQVIKAALDLGLHRRALRDDELQAGWAQADLLHQPERASPAWRAFSERIGLHWPGRARADSRLAA